MSKEFEIEFKVLLDEQLYTKLYKDLTKFSHNLYTQTNYYMTHPILDQKKFMLRIREKNNKYELTLKQPYHDHSIESNILINDDIKNNIFNKITIDNEIFDELSKYGIKQSELENNYNLKTTRLDVKFDYGTLSLDLNVYLDTIDYELEFEVTDPIKGLQQFNQILSDYNINYTKNCDSKIKRIKKIYNKG